jgi:hypothetical protein
MYIAQFDTTTMILSYLQKIEFEELIINLQHLLDRKRMREYNILNISQI